MATLADLIEVAIEEAKGLYPLTDDDVTRIREYITSDDMPDNSVEMAEKLDREHEIVIRAINYILNRVGEVVDLTSDD